MEPRIILHLDMDSFYASVEMQAHPELRNKPVVIGADPKQGRGRGVVSTCSYEARAFGIRSAMPVSQAFVLCPHAIFRPPDFPLYAKASGEVMTIIRSFGFSFQQVSIDEAFLDLSPLGTFQAAELFARQIRDTIGKDLGLSCSIGIGKSKLIAKIASDFKKPAGLTVVEPAATELFLSPLPQPSHDLPRVFFGPLLVIRVVEQTGQRPFLGIVSGRIPLGSGIPLGWCRR